ncbi:hypothetical protein F5Y06DRAFT_276874 [Hypoxylon sp. FL0890]|nr:hypothetical protein F5Y06DRAFT_276874 [Hypoxylon sp. FL0890]
MNRVLTDMYNCEESTWLNDTLSLVKKHIAHREQGHAFTGGITSRSSSQFPSPVSDPLDIPELRGNELSFFLQTRYLCVIEWLHSSFLYCIVHLDSSRAQISSQLSLAHLAQRSLDVSCTSIKLIAMHHRHGGIRSAPSYALYC